MLEERECACDEDALGLCPQPHIYAESILKVCEFCLGSPLACLSGVSGADLNKRIIRIMSKRVIVKLNLGKRVLLITTGVMVTVAPILLGQANPRQGQTALKRENSGINLPAFDVVSVKVNHSGAAMFSSRVTPDGMNASNTPVLMLIRQAYGLFNSNDDLITGAPSWVKSERYDIQAKVTGTDIPALAKLSREQHNAMLQALLADRFKLTAHREIKEMPVYALIIAKNGPELKEAKPGDTYVNGIRGSNGPGGPGMMTMRRGYIEGQAIHMSELISMLTQKTGRTVLDETGLTGQYDVVLQWTPDEGSEQVPNGPTGNQEGAISNSGPSIFTAVQEQLGLKLDSQKGPVEGLVIDHIERPSEN